MLCYVNSDLDVHEVRIALMLCYVNSDLDVEEIRIALSFLFSS